MSGGYFGYSYDPTYLEGEWQDAEIDELYRDLFCSGEFSVRGYGGLFQSLDFWLSSDINEASYRDAVRRFKEKWFRRTPKNRIEFYEKRIQEYADRCKAELGLDVPGEVE